MLDLFAHAEKELEGWEQEFEDYIARFDYVFWRSEPRAQAAKYVRGLLSPLEQKNSCQLAEAMGDETPDATQRLIYHAQWAADEAMKVLRQFIVERFGDGEGIGIIDETGFLRDGTRSVGVQRQYSGTAGKVENCQIGTFLCYATRQGNVFLDRRLFLPEEWCADEARRGAGGVPKEVVFQTKPQQAAAMLEAAWEAGVRMPWVTADEVYGNAPALRKCISEHQRHYVLAVSSNAPVWRERPAVEEPHAKRGSTELTKPRLAEGASPPERADVVVAGWREQQWHRLTIAEGEKGPRTYDWARARVIEDAGGLPGEEVWLLARRSITDPSDIAYYLSNAPLDTPLQRLAEIAGNRWVVEECIKEAKGQAGLDHYEARRWNSWHRHITLSLMAHTLLVALRQRAAENTDGPVPFWKT